MDYLEIREKVRQNVSETRFLHSQNVSDVARELAAHYHADLGKAEIAGILHDYAKNINKEQSIEIFKKFGLVIDDITLNNPKLLHGPVGACLAQYELGIVDTEILDAIWFHTTAKSNMNLLTKIVYIADFIEIGKQQEGIEGIRALAYKDIDSAIIAALNIVIFRTINKGLLVHPDSIHARNYLIMVCDK